MATSARDVANAQHMYRVGDYVYFENVSSGPFAIRRIEELSKNASGNVEARVMCFFRRQELPDPLVLQADKHHFGDDPMLEEEAKQDKMEAERKMSYDDDSDDEANGDEKARREAESKKAEMAAKQRSEDREKRLKEREEFKLREVFLSRHVETLPATLIRGKCSVTLFSEVETPQSYTERNDAFFYALVYDPQQKTLVADRGEIRIGANYQATVPQSLKSEEKEQQDEERKDGNEGQQVWDPYCCSSKLNSSDIDKFLVVARSVGTFARALDCSSSVKQPSLHMSAAAASRDVTLFYAHDLLHSHKYDLAEAVKALVPQATGPVMCRDEMEDWSAAEANLFEEAIEKYGKDFNDIRKDFLPWKSMKDLVEYFFMWKTTDRYVQQKRIKALEQESKLKQVYVPPYVNKTTRLTGVHGEVIVRGRDCDAYPNLPRYSWVHFKKYGKLVPSSGAIDDSFILDKGNNFTSTTAARLAQLRPGLIIEPGSPLSGPQKTALAASGTASANAASSGKSRSAFLLRTTPLARASRQICRKICRLKHFARKPGIAIDMKGVKTEALAQAKTNSINLRRLNTFRPIKRKSMGEVIQTLAANQSWTDEVQQWLVLTPKEQMAQPRVQAFPRPEKRADGSYIYEPVVQPVTASVLVQPHLYKKRAYDDVSILPPSAVAPSMKMARMGTDQVSVSRQPVQNLVAPKGKVAVLTRNQGGQKISWMDAPDDVYYKATTSTKRMRKKLSIAALRRAARKPFKKVLSLSLS